MNKLTKINKVDISLKQLSDLDTQNGSYDRVDNIRNGQILTAYVNSERTDQFRFRYLTDILVAGSGITFVTTNGITTISSSGGGASTLAALTDVNLTSPTIGDILWFNGTDWYNAPAPSGGGGGLEYGIAAGTNTYTVTIAGVTAYTAGDVYAINFTNGNDDDSTININGLGAQQLVKEFDVQVTGGDIVSGQELILIYDGTNFQCIGVAPNQLFAFVTNDDSVTITKGQPVYAFGAAGNRMSVKLAYNTSDATSAQTVGLVFSTSIAAGQKGFIITQGVISGVNTGAYSPGDTLYLGATAGTLTSTKPFAPNHLVYIGTVERANAGNGQIYVRPQNGFEMNEIHDVQSNGAVNNDILYRDTTATPNLWKPASIPTILGYTPADINSPAFTGTPTAPTAPSGTNTTQIATTAFVQTAVEQSSSLVGVFGDGGSGNATITGSISLTADAYYNDLTISGAGSIFLNGYRLFVKGTLDISNAGSLAIHNSGFTGDAATGVTAGNNSGAGTVGRGGYGVTTTGWFSGGTGSGVVYRGGNGAGGASINTNNAGTGGTSPVSTQMVAGGFGGAGGKGGNSSVGTGGNGGSGQSSSQSPSTFYIRTFINDQGRIQLTRFNTTGVSATQNSAGAFHGGGGGGAGSSTIALGGGGAAGGGGGGITIVYARQIVVGAGTAADAIASRGGDGGGVTFAGNANAGGGGGGAGGGGGYIYLVYGTITGGSYTFASANGGTGGKGGNGQGTGFGGQGGQGGSGGRITAISLGYNTITVVDGTTNLGTVATIPVTTTGSLGGAGGTCTFSS